MLSPLAELRAAPRACAWRRGAAASPAAYVGAPPRPTNATWTGSAAPACSSAATRPSPPGCFDERYFMYEEDVDFCAALRAQGGRILFTPAAEVVHLRGRSIAPRRTTHGAPALRPQPPRLLREAPARAGRPGSGAGCGCAAGAFDRIIAEPACESPSTRASCTTTASARTSAISSASWRGRTTTPSTSLLCRAGGRRVRCARSARASSRSSSAPATTRVREQMSVPLALARARVDLFHAPHYVVSPLTRCPFVVTIHDCIHLRFPQYLPNRARPVLRARR